MKTCKSCGETKPFSEFYKAARAKDGCASRCKACDLQYQRNRKQEKQLTSVKWYRSEKGQQYKEKLRLITKQKRMAWAEEKLRAFNTASLEGVLLWRRNAAVRHAAKLKATPHWLTRKQRSRAMQVYALTQQLQEVLGSIYHVDHIVPLISDQVCGLHVWWNLQPLSEIENVKKNNLFNPAIYPAQGEVAFPEGDGPEAGRIPAQAMERNDDE